jgi:hypothetical protein
MLAAVLMLSSPATGLNSWLHVWLNDSKAKATTSALGQQLLAAALLFSCGLQDLATGYMSGKLLLKLEAVHYMLAHHTSAYYSFLDHAANSRNRTCYYNTLARLLFMEDAPSRFKAFMTPLQSVSERMLLCLMLGFVLSCGCCWCCCICYYNMLALLLLVEDVPSRFRPS